MNTIVEKTIVNFFSPLKNKKELSYDNYDILKNLIRDETNTTEYLLRALSHNYIGLTPFNIVKINNNNPQLSIDLPDILDNYKLILPEIKPRLIMAFGPSASGKTTISKQMIELFSTKYDNFPTCFMTLDGGKFRKASFVYQYIIKVANEHNINIASYNLFPKVKHTIMKYYENQILQYNTCISLYISITLGKSELQSYKQYIEITKDYNWIGIFIWQHKFDCPNEGKDKCYGCAKSGIEREKIEGKKYKLYKWRKSMSRGLEEVKKAKGDYYIIHNGGRPYSNNIINCNEDINIL